MKARGFTLLEFILYFALISIVVGMVAAFAVDMVKTRAKTAAIAEVEQNMRFGMQRILGSVRQATKLNAGTSNFDAATGVLSVDMPDPAATPTVFDLVDGVLRIKEGAAAAVPLTSPGVRVTALRFSKDSLGGNNVAITAEMSVVYRTDNPDVLFNYASSASATAVIRKD
ncbi:MAG TPA: prepilin-type N-terminal cleavage/methylation domain-containing protein [Patescibacteria group bacterium]|nr:prepilin-type N-terminal cleavage/methylation domain-containing protein [Patescibacteria group bacterium]